MRPPLVQHLLAAVGVALAAGVDLRGMALVAVVAVLDGAKTHLRHAYGKLGVSSKEDVQALFDE